MGAWDNPLAGQSTYYVELQQTSHILKHVTPRSLVQKKTKQKHE